MRIYQIKFVLVMIRQILVLSIISQAFLSYTDICANNDPEVICGADGRTYKNKCYARRVGVEVAYFGECANCENCKGMEEPVCANDGRTYINSCWADCRGLIVLHTGKCPPECKCPNTLDIVCGADGKTYKNYCHADCNNTTIAYKGQCGRNCS